MKKLILLLLSIFLLLAVSCNLTNPKSPIEFLTKGASTWEEVFKGYWAGLSDSYVFWNIDDANNEWDNIYTEYLPKFRSLGKVNYDDRNTTKEATILLFDMSKNLSDGHFSLNVRKGEGQGNERKFCPGDFRLIKEGHPELSDREIIESFIFKEQNILLPDEVLSENARYILENIFKVQLNVKYDPKLDSKFSEYSSEIFYIQDESYSLINPKIQVRVRGYTQLLLYSNDYKYGSYVDNGSIKPCSNDTDFNTHVDAGDAGPYYPISDLSWYEYNYDTSTIVDVIPVLNDAFKTWTLALGVKDMGFGGKKSVLIDFYSLSAMTKETDVNCGVGKVDYTKNTVYFLLSSFDCTSYMEINEVPMTEYLKYFHKLKIDSNAEGLVIDMRGNIGGSNADRQLLFGDLVDDKFMFGYQINKTGLGRHDLTLPSPVYIYPEKELFDEVSTLFSKPVAVITNRFTISNGEMTTFIVKALEKGGQVGGTTYGAQGTLFGDTISVGAGQFCVGDVITSVYTPYAQILDINKKSYEGKGCTPDVEIPFDETEFCESNDARLNAGFKWIKDHI